MRVLTSMLRGSRPARPGLQKHERNMDDNLWNYIQRAWAQDPKAWPTAEQFVVELQSLLQREVATTNVLVTRSPSS